MSPATRNPSPPHPHTPQAWLKVREAGGAVLLSQARYPHRVPTSERATIHKNLILSLASAEGFLMTSEWAKASKVGNQLWDQESMWRSPPLLPAGGVLAPAESESQRVQMAEPFPDSSLDGHAKYDRGIRVRCAQSRAPW